MNGLLVALVIALVIAVIAAVAFGVSWYRQKDALDTCTEATSAVCDDLVGAETAHVAKFLAAVQKLRPNSPDLIPVLRQFQKEAFGVAEMYQNVAAYCPQIAEEVDSRINTHVWDVSAYVDIAATHPAQGLSSLKSHLATHLAALQ